MKNYIITKIIKFVLKYNDYDKEKQEELKYGLLSIYLLITKLIVIILLSIILNISKEVLIFILIYSVIKMFSFGLHATKSWICLISSTIIFIGIPYLCKNIIIPLEIKIITCSLGIIFMYINSPADTHKRPIINKNRRLIYKYLSVTICIIFSFLSLITSDFISDCLIMSILLQNIIISPLTYKIFKLPYNNYLNYIKV